VILQRFSNGQQWKYFKMRQNFPNKEKRFFAEMEL